ncbi:MAG: cytochrome c [Ferruginibacter sp.]
MKGVYILVLAAMLASCGGNTDRGNTASATQEPVASVNEKGEQLFKINCQQCHMPKKDFAAPALAGAEKRWESKDLLYDFVRNSAAVIEKNKYAADLFEKWKQAPMLPFPQLTNEDIDAILEYCNQAP